MIERPNVISSVYSNSSPMLMPRAKVVRRTLKGASLREMKKFVVSPSIVGLKAKMIS